MNVHSGCYEKTQGLSTTSLLDQLFLLRSGAGSSLLAGMGPGRHSSATYACCHHVAWLGDPGCTYCTTTAELWHVEPASSQELLRYDRRSNLTQAFRTALLELQSLLAVGLTKTHAPQAGDASIPKGSKYLYGIYIGPKVIIS